MARNEQTPTRLFKMPPLRMPDIFAAPAAPERMTPSAPPPARRSYGYGPSNMAPFEIEAMRRPKPDIQIDTSVGMMRSVNDIPLQYDFTDAANAIAEDRRVTLTKLGQEPPPAEPVASPRLKYIDLYGRVIGQMTGVSPDYMRSVVLAESADDAHADNPSSTARGLTQNTVGNWLDPEDGIRKWGPTLGWDEQQLNMARTLDQMDPAQLDALIAKLPPVSNTGDTFTSGVDTTTPEMQLAGMARALRDSVDQTDFVEAKGDKSAPSFEDLYLLRLRRDPRWALAVSAMQARGQHDILSLRLGRDPEYWEMYAMHFGGTKGGQKILFSPDNAPIESVLDPLAREQNASMLKGIKTAKQFRERLQKKFPQRWLSVEDID